MTDHTQINKSVQSKKYSYDLTIVIPAYKEADRIEATLHTLKNYLDNTSFFTHIKVEIIVVIADSTDGTYEAVHKNQYLFKNRMKILVPTNEHEGKGRDVQYGMLKANGRLVTFMDADLATPLYHLEAFYKIYSDNNKVDIVIGIRNLYRHHKSKKRRLISSIGNILFRIVSGLYIKDSQCGFKMFTNSAAKLCFSDMSINGWGFDMEILTIAKYNKLHIEALPINDWKHIPGGTFDNNIYKNTLRNLKDLFAITINKIRGVYKSR